MIRVGFTLIGGANWTGGHNYLLNLLDLLTQYQSDRITPVLFVGEDCQEGISPFHEIQGLKIIKTPYLDMDRRKKSLLMSLLWGHDPGLRKAFRKQKIDLVFENAQFFGWRLGIPAIAWIPDFQHKVLPKLFSRGLWLKREIGFRMQVVSGRTIMLSSEDAQNDCEHFYPSTQGRTRTVRFAVPPASAIVFAQARRIADLYGLPEHFFFMPNQFFRHKNHGLVLEALTLLVKKGKKIVVAASGQQADPRDSTYFPKFQAELENLGLQKEFKLLGLIPYDHLSLLMRSCTALLNPSLFEGWSTTVEEARAMGTPMVLSDLDVHKEQMGDQAVYFDRRSAHSLACALDGFTALPQAQRDNRMTGARADGVKRVKLFAQEFVTLVETCVNKTKNL